MGEVAAAVTFVAGLILVTVILVRLGDRRARRAYAPIVQRFGFEHTTDDRGQLDSLSIEGDWHGSVVRIRIDPGGRYDPTRLIFTLSPRTSLSVPGVIHVRRRRALDRIAVAIGLSRRLWKRSYRDWGLAFVEAEDDRYAEALVAQSRFREAVLPLVRLQRPSVFIESEEIRLTLSGPLLRRGRNLKPARVQRVLDRLEEIAALDYPDPAQIPAASPREDGAKSGDVESVRARLQGSRRRFAVMPMITAAAALMFIGPLILWWGTRYPPLTWELHKFGIILGVGAILLYGVLLFPVVRGYSRSLSTYSTLLFFALIGFPSFFAGTPVVLNGLADNAQPMHVSGVISGKKDGRVVVAIPLTETGSGEAHLRVPDRIRHALDLGDRVQIPVRRGALGFLWFDSRDVHGR